MKSILKFAGRVGVPRKGEMKCPNCSGTGIDPAFGYQLMGGCETCWSTGVVPLGARQAVAEIGDNG